MLDLFLTGGLILLVANLLLTARVALVATQARDARRQGVDAALLESMSESMEVMRSEFIPANGASISYRINGLTEYANAASVNALYAKSAADEARLAVRDAKDGIVRVELRLSDLQKAIDQRTVNMIQTNADTGQVSAGQGNRQQ